MILHDTFGYKVVNDWLKAKGLHPFLFQEQAWQHIIDGSSGVVNAPTGCGKTFSVFLGALIDFINKHPDDYRTRSKNGLQLLWITPLRALGKDIARAMEEVITELGMQWKVGIRNGDTDMAERQRQKRQMPEALVITPESMHLLLAQKNYPELFRTLRIIAVDEWHELLGSKRGVQVELALSRLCHLSTEKKLQIWGISATIGNLDQAREVLLSPLGIMSDLVKAEVRKKIVLESILPDEIEKISVGRSSWIEAGE